ncbi:hypothetical protein NEHOM01_2361 [Nematocida homosporus]|uniref:uncharacterized protein n=1 Tax=Nematocida homosporus TaxID=1912981 RepID=UPI00221ECEC9|nr:uncharacterized protein NEHOM01_2361 [Nematocida homosporus]KAI5187780.1 hypothetical protein NEHOM01_2361 [Nematocida homosporus]
MVRDVKRSTIKTIVLVWIRIISIVIGKQNVLDHTQPSKGQTTLVISNIEGGLGDVSWAANIGKELESITGIQPTYLFVGNIKPEVIRHLNKRSDLGGELRIIRKPTEVDPGYAGAYVCEAENGSMYTALALSDIEFIGEKFDCTVLFRMQWNSTYGMDNQPTRVWKRFIPVEEYGDIATDDIRKEVRIFFQDYTKKYRTSVLEADCVRLNVSVDEFYNKLGADAKKQFNLEYVKQLEKKIGMGVPYHFVYYNLFVRREDFDDLCLMTQIALAHIMNLQGRENQSPDTPITFLVNQIDLCKRAEIYENKLWESNLWMEKWNGLPESKRDEADRQEKIQMLLKKGDVTIGSDGLQQIRLLNTKRTARLVPYENLSPEAFEYFLLKSELVAGCTGDMSFTQVISSKRIPVYECLTHKQRFYNYALNAPWIETLEKIGVPVEKGLAVFPGIGRDRSTIVLSGATTLTAKNVRQVYPIFRAKLQQNAFSPWFRMRVKEALKTKEPKQGLPEMHPDK